MKKFFLLAALLLWITGCAGVDITRVASDSDYRQGIRFYRPYPYVLITMDKDTKALLATTIFLPNMKEEYVINVRSGLGTVNSSFDLTDGWNLTKFGDIRDSQIPETITALAGFLKETVTGEINGKPITEKLEPGLYRYSFDKSGFADGLVPVFRFKDVLK